MRRWNVEINGKVIMGKNAVVEVSFIAIIKGKVAKYRGKRLVPRLRPQREAVLGMVLKCGGEVQKLILKIDRALYAVLRLQLARLLR